MTFQKLPDKSSSNESLCSRRLMGSMDQAKGQLISKANSKLFI